MLRSPAAGQYASRDGAISAAAACPRAAVLHTQSHAGPSARRHLAPVPVRPRPLRPQHLVGLMANAVGTAPRVRDAPMEWSHVAGKRPIYRPGACVGCLAP